MTAHRLFCPFIVPPPPMMVNEKRDSFSFPIPAEDHRISNGILDYVRNCKKLEVHLFLSFYEGNRYNIGTNNNTTYRAILTYECSRKKELINVFLTNQLVR